MSVNQLLSVDRLETLTTSSKFSIFLNIMMEKNNIRSIFGDVVNSIALRERFTPRRCKKLTSCHFKNDAKNDIISKIVLQI